MWRCDPQPGEPSGRRGASPAARSSRSAWRSRSRRSRSTSGSGGVGLFFDLGFVALCLGLALAVRPTDFFVVGVLPPLIMVGVFVLLEATRPGVHRAARATAWSRPWSPGSPTTAARLVSATCSSWPPSPRPAALRRPGRGPTRPRSGDEPRPGRRHPPARPPGRPPTSRRPWSARRGLLAGSTTMSTWWSSSSLTSQPMRPRLVLAGQDQRAGEQRLAERLEQRAGPRRGRGSARRRCASWGASAAAAPRRSPGG